MRGKTVTKQICDIEAKTRLVGKGLQEPLGDSGRVGGGGLCWVLPLFRVAVPCVLLSGILREASAGSFCCFIYLLPISFMLAGVKF